MSRIPARVTQADVARSVRAAKQAGASAVEVRGESIFIYLTEIAGGESLLKPLADQGRPPF
jgi:hypothetical protein